MRITSSEEITLLDLISIISFCVSLQNLELNLNEQDLNEQTQALDKSLKAVVDDIHSHLSVQDAKLNLILNKLEELK